MDIHLPTIPSIRDTDHVTAEVREPARPAASTNSTKAAAWGKQPNSAGLAR
jgi:hypothetical protein